MEVLTRYRRYNQYNVTQSILPTNILQHHPVCRTGCRKHNQISLQVKSRNSGATCYAVVYEDKFRATVLYGVEKLETKDITGLTLKMREENFMLMKNIIRVESIILFLLSLYSRLCRVSARIISSPLKTKSFLK